MKIIQIVPGFGGMYYCGNCLRDSSLVKTLRQEGHDAITLPMYLPLTINGNMDPQGIPVFYGAVNIYLKQNFRLFRKMPGWMERIFNSPLILRFAARKAGSTRANGLEAMTESMLLGVDGFQRKELNQLVAFLKTEKPDVIHLSNALLLGLAREIRKEVKVPVFYSLQDEDVWVDAMGDSYRERIWDLMAEKGKDVDGFIAVSHFFGRVMQDKMRIPNEKLFVVHVGVNPDAYEQIPPVKKSPAIGYLSRINEGNGFGLFVDAFILLKQKPEFSQLRLVATGGMTTDDKAFLRQQMNKLKVRNLLDQVEIRHDFRQESLKDFFRKVSVLSVPVLRGEAFGLYQLEALASGVPLVQPAVGAFPEIIEATGGGELYYPNTASVLALKLADVLLSPDKLERYSQNGIKAVAEEFSCLNLAKKMVQVYQKIIETKE